MQRLGLFGGAFNPVHLGHLLVAQAALEELDLDQLFFIPARQSPFKQEIPTAPAEMRLQWLRLALAGQSHYVVDDQEIRRSGVSYTIETVRDYVKKFPHAKLFWLIGADNVILATDEVFGALNSALRDARRWIADPDRLPSPPRRCLHA